MLLVSLILIDWLWCMWAERGEAQVFGQWKNLGLFYPNLGLDLDRIALQEEEKEKKKIGNGRHELTDVKRFGDLS